MLGCPLLGLLESTDHTFSPPHSPPPVPCASSPARYPPCPPPQSWPRHASTRAEIDGESETAAELERKLAFASNGERRMQQELLQMEELHRRAKDKVGVLGSPRPRGQLQVAEGHRGHSPDWCRCCSVLAGQGHWRGRSAPTATIHVAPLAPPFKSRVCLFRCSASFWNTRPTTGSRCWRMRSTH